MSTPDAGKTPHAPDEDQPHGGAHSGEDQQAASGQTPGTPGIDEPETTSAQ
jgi:hypothetical protein